METPSPIRTLVIGVISLSLTAGAFADEAGFEPIFDGQTLDQWDGNPKFWRVEEGAITGETTKENPTDGNTFIVWRGGQLGDFELKLQYKIVGGNSGIQYRSFEVAEKPWVIGGYQADFEAGDRYSGILYGERFRGILGDRGQETVVRRNKDDDKVEVDVVGSVGDSDAIQAKIRKEEWNDYHIVARGYRFEHRINGVTTVKVTDRDSAVRRAWGLLALQLHAGPAMKVQFRDIRLKRLTADDLPQHVEYPGREGPGKGKRIVLISGDDEYRSEETLPQLGKILSQHHGFDATVLFSIDPKTGVINPEEKANIPGLEALEQADLMVIFTRFRHLSPERMQYVESYLQKGKPVIGLRTATHGFNAPAESESGKWSYNSQIEGYKDGFGRVVLGETWVNHHGHHGKESTRGVIVPAERAHPILRGVHDIWGPTDVYGVRLPLPHGCKPLVLGQVLRGMQPSDDPVSGEKNDPMMPIAWTMPYHLPGGTGGVSFTTTMGASQDFESEGLRRMLVNACYWAVGLGDAIPAEGTNVDLVGEFKPTPFGFKAYQRGVRPIDHGL